MKLISLTALLATLSGAALAEAHAHASGPLVVEAADQSVAGGTVTADRVVAEANGWLVVHRTDAEMAPGPVIGHAPLRAGERR